MGYRNKPIYIYVGNNLENPENYELFLSVSKVSNDYRHSAPLMREILFEFLQGKHIQESYADYLYIENNKSFFNDDGTFKKRYSKITDNYLCSEYFLDAWSYFYFVDVFECKTIDECNNETRICKIFHSSIADDWLTNRDTCFFYCLARDEKTINTLKRIIERVIKKAERILIYTSNPPNIDCYTNGEETYYSPDINIDIGLNVKSFSDFNSQPRFDKYPLYLFVNENGLSLATSPDCQYAALNRLLDGAFYRGLSEHFDVSLELDTVSEAVFEFAGETDRCYRDGNSLIIRQMDDCMFSDFLRTYTIDTLFYPKGAWGEKKENPLFKLSFSPMGLNANLIANFEIYDKSVVDIIKSVMTDIAEKYKRTLYFNAKPPLAKMPEAVKNNPREHLDVILNGKCGTKLKGKEKRLKKEHDRIMKLRNGESLPPSLLERIRAFLTK